ncbi:YcdB/YcdC domain-containing protein [Cohnella hongkongensis]|uniref:YcdB/YcdC domain-containing protein n=1 Tax=Cohnella hongkongensis TaxID=178337 RepID=A0ABV9FF14_9BACL
MAIEQLDMEGLWQHWEEELALTGLHRHASRIRQQLSSINHTEYRIELEWFPEAGQGEDERNPPGAVMVELDRRTRALRSFHIVRYGDANMMQGTACITQQQAKALALQWVERFAGLTEEAGNLELVHANDKEEAAVFSFRQTLDGIPFYPPMPIQVKVAWNGQVVAFSNYFVHMSQDITIHNSPQSPPSAEQEREVALAAFELIYAPESRELPAWFYGVGETFLNTATGETMPYELHAPFLGQPPLDRRLLWEHKPGARETNLEPFQPPSSIGERVMQHVSSSERYDGVIDWNAVHPDAVPIRSEELERIYEAVCEWGSRMYPEESGQWKITRVLRKSGIIMAILERYDAGYTAAFRVKVMVDSESFNVISDMRIGHLPKEAPDVMDKEQAFQRIAASVISKPYLVWHSQKRSYQFMHMIDCPSMVDARSGEVAR